MHLSIQNVWNTKGMDFYLGFWNSRKVRFRNSGQIPDFWSRISTKLDFETLEEAYIFLAPLWAEFYSFDKKKSTSSL